MAQVGVFLIAFRDGLYLSSTLDMQELSLKINDFYNWIISFWIMTFWYINIVSLFRNLLSFNTI